MTNEQIRAIAQQVAKDMEGLHIDQHLPEFLVKCLAAINAKAEPVTLYPCGFKSLHSLVIEKGAFLARNLNEDEPVTDEIRSAAMVLVGYAKDMSSLLAKQPLYTHPAIEPAPQERIVPDVSDSTATPVGAAPLPDDVAKMASRLRYAESRASNYGHVMLEAADMLERLAIERANFHMEYRMKCDVETKALNEEVERLARQVPELEQQRDELLADMKLIEHATAPTHDDGAYHENAYSIAVAALAKVKP